jgi:glycogen synthase
LAADALATVSEGYAAEVQQAEGPYGCGLADILAARGVRCVLRARSI